MYWPVLGSIFGVPSEFSSHNPMLNSCRKHSVGGQKSRFNEGRGKTVNNLVRNGTRRAHTLHAINTSLQSYLHDFSGEILVWVLVQA